MWTKIWFLAGSIAYGAPFKFLPAQYKDGNGSVKSTETSKRQRKKGIEDGVANTCI